MTHQQKVLIYISIIIHPENLPKVCHSLGYDTEESSFEQALWLKSGYMRKSSCDYSWLE